jgi:hypothetical protein
MLENVEVDQDECFLTRTRPCLVKIFTATEDTDISVALDQAENDASDIMRLLSFLSREWVDWFELSIETTSGSEEYLSAHGIRRIQIWRKSQEDDYEDPIISKEEFSGDTFADLLNSLRTSPHAEDLIRTIAYSLSSREGKYADVNFILAFSALETLINTLDERLSLLKPQEIFWSALCRSLKKCIDGHAEAKNLSAEKTQLVKSKLGELKRPSICDKIHFHASIYNIKTGDLWMHPITGESQFSEGLERAIGQRNQIVHRTSIKSLGDLQNDLPRIQLLFERFVLRLLDYGGDVSCRAIYDI